MRMDSFHVFSDTRFLDLAAYQYGSEQCKPLHSFGPAIRNHYLFHYVLSGQGTLEVVLNSDEKAVSYRVQAGQGFLIEPEYITTYTADPHDPWEYMWIEFDGLRAGELISEAGLSAADPVFTPSSPADVDAITREMLYMIEHPDVSDLHFIGHLYLFLDLLITASSRRKKIQNGKLSRFYAQEAISFIEQFYPSPITVEDMAKRCNLDRSYFAKVFKDTIGQSPQEFLIHYRMTKASALLTMTDLPISSICGQVGYPNQLHFSRAFKNVYGVPPRTYRQNHKQISLASDDVDFREELHEPVHFQEEIL